MLLGSSRPLHTQRGPPARPLTNVYDIARSKRCSSLAVGRGALARVTALGSPLPRPFNCRPLPHLSLRPSPTTPVVVLRRYRPLCCLSPFSLLCALTLPKHHPPSPNALCNPGGHRVARWKLAVAADWRVASQLLCALAVNLQSGIWFRTADVHFSQDDCHTYPTFHSAVMV